MALKRVLPSRLTGATPAPDSNPDIVVRPDERNLAAVTPNNAPSPNQTVSSGVSSAVVPNVPNQAAEAAARSEFLQAAAMAFAPPASAPSASAMPAPTPAVMLPSAATAPESNVSAASPTVANAAAAPTVMPIPDVVTEPAAPPSAALPESSSLQASRPVPSRFKRNVNSASAEAAAPNPVAVMAPMPTMQPMPDVPAEAIIAKRNVQPFVMPVVSVRAIRPRDWSAVAPLQVLADQSAEMLQFSENVPVNTTLISQVDQRLTDSGLLAAPPPDSLTRNLPTASAEEVWSPKPIPDAEPLATQGIAPTAPTAAPAFSLSNKPKAEDVLPASDLPWATGNAGDWDIEAPMGHGDADGTTMPVLPQPPGDLYKPLVNSSAAGLWDQNRPASPPELPGQRPSRGPAGAKKSGGGAMFTVVLLGAGVLGGAWWWNQQQTPATPASPIANPAAVAPTNQPVMPGQSLTAEGQPTTNPGLLPPPNPALTSNASIQFVDVPPSEANQPITGDNAPPVPEDLSLLGKFKQEVERQKALKDGTQPSTTTPDVYGTALAAAPAGPLTPAQLQAELASYREALAKASNVESLPKPGAFLRDPDGFMDGKNQLAQPGPGTPVGGPLGADGKPMPMDANAALLPPPAPGTENRSPRGEVLPPPNLYTNNPANLPVVGEPQVNQPKVRQLTDFSDAVFAPERPKVRVPQGLKPRLGVQGFPNLEVLSLVPNKGIVAFAGGREGVLLLGESYDGWQLLNVTAQGAEFQAGESRHTATVGN